MNPGPQTITIPFATPRQHDQWWTFLNETLRLEDILQPQPPNWEEMTGGITREQLLDGLERLREYGERPVPHNPLLYQPLLSARDLDTLRAFADEPIHSGAEVPGPDDGLRSPAG